MASDGSPLRLTTAVMFIIARVVTLSLKAFPPFPFRASIIIVC